MDLHKGLFLSAQMPAVAAGCSSMVLSILERLRGNRVEQLMGGIDIVAASPDQMEASATQLPPEHGSPDARQQQRSDSVGIIWILQVRPALHLP